MQSMNGSVGLRVTGVKPPGRGALSCRRRGGARLRGGRDLHYRGVVSVARRWSRVTAIATALAVTGCAHGPHEGRSQTLASVLAEADLALLRARPALVEGRYRRMAASAYDFYRGSLAVFAHDWRDASTGLSATRFGVDGPAVFGLCDPHPENFGTLLAADGTLSLQPNDLDAADAVPYLWDLRRLVVGLALATRIANPSTEPEDVARAGARAYADALGELAAGAPRPVLTAGGGVPALDDLFRRGSRDAAQRAELSSLTVTAAGPRALRRGVIDADDPENVLVELPAVARDALPETLARYRDTLPSPPASPTYFRVLDAARELGSGVASWPRVRALVLVEGPTEAPGDDVVLELKELADPIRAPVLPPFVAFRDVASRVAAARSLWSRPAADPLWGTSTWLGLPVQLRAETEAAKTLRVARLTGAAASPEALVALARTLGATLAGVHSVPLPDGSRALPVIAAVVARDPGGFAAEQAAVAVRYARRVRDDHTRFVALLRELGPRLGVTPEPGDEPSSALRALLAEPPPPR